MSSHAPDAKAPSLARTAALSLGALGVVYGDIGTSPLYAIKECFHGMHAIAVTPENVLGVLSLIFWSLTMVITVKYVLFITAADNRGEGGIFALIELLPRDAGHRHLRAGLAFLALCGAALLYGDGVITPAISVLSAVEGLNVATNAAEPLVVPITCVILFGLFMVQRRGTAGIGKVFGPIMMLWFLVLATLGLKEILSAPQVLWAINPIHAVDFFARNHVHGIVVLGAVVLCITGGEALYADLGHFGRKPIQYSWLLIVFPCLLLNYFGQGAGLLLDPAIASNPFYSLVPGALIYPMAALSTAATVIASQALISGVFSLTRQAIQLGCCPRLRIVHTSSAMEGQIYIPEVNFALMWACIGLTLAFKESSRLAAAYGIAVTATMGITSLLYFFVARWTWKHSLLRSLAPVVVFLAFDLSFFAANLLKVADGGWFTLLIAALVVMAMATWEDGRKALRQIYLSSTVPLRTFLAEVAVKNPLRVPGTAVFMSLSPQGTPVTLLHHYKHNKIFHENVVILTVTSADMPYVPEPDQLDVQDLGRGFFRIIARYGFMETPNVPEVMKRARATGIPIDPPADTTYFLGRESLLTTGKAKMAGFRKSLFALMSRNARPATAYFGLPPGRVVELGVQVEL
ncbi:potassium transporter [Solidesulfovibrio carbinoliphilus subsp. oakridgensis]|uniref:Probable potassium transport system protein Kup n=1 Tax=Solidesulfovibrio carbinoliphilus subsp. oakridgensis TaxID=694327 RepID=G7Q4N9_9BACT|nr:potassium transporter Kup [Solidesulfovibrio carbinoliphilus]EHJ47499.1 potassium transporter [Solidesulfovibrio carbinoliphilus subsp. oakridgensis]